MKFFPTLPLSKLLYGYFGYWDIPLSEEDDPNGDKNQENEEEDYMGVILVSNLFSCLCLLLLKFTSYLGCVRRPLPFYPRSPDRG